TGTNGKTTATAMATAMLQAAGLAAVSVGNIGTPPGVALVADERADYLVAEVSSFQLHWAPSFTPDTGVLLNLAEDHLDWHGSMAATPGISSAPFGDRAQWWRWTSNSSVNSLTTTESLLWWPAVCRTLPRYSLRRISRSLWAWLRPRKGRSSPRYPPPRTVN